MADTTGGAAGGFAEALARFTGKHRKPILGCWIAALLVAAFSALSLSSALSGGGWSAPGSQSEQAADALARSGMLGRGEVALTLVVHDEHHTATEPEFRQRADEAFRAVREDPLLNVRDAYGWATTADREPFTGSDERTVTTALAAGVDDGTARRELPGIQDRLTRQFEPRGLEVALVGQPAFWGEVNVLSQQDLVVAELITFPLLALVLLLLYRSLVAAAASLVVGGTAIALTFGSLSPLAHHTELSVFVENSATMLGLGVAVDYSLFIISRFQRELSRGATVPEAVAISLRYSGHTVLFSGLTVLASMSALFVVDLGAIRSLALGAVVVVAFAMLVSVLVLPALLHVLGHRIFRGRVPLPRPRGGNGWGRFAERVMRRPKTYGLVTLVLLGLLALPAGNLSTFSPDVRVVPTSSPVRAASDLIQQQFGVGATSPVQVVVRSGDPATLAAVEARLAGLPHVTGEKSALTVLSAVSPERPWDLLRPEAFAALPPDVRQAVDHYLAPDRSTALIELDADVRPSDDAAADLVRAARQAVAGYDAVVGGETAEGVDANEIIQDSLPLVVVIMLGVVFVLLLITFRSVLLPVKAVLMNVVSLGVTYGVLVAVFQYGFGTEALGLTRTGQLMNFVPILLLAVLFGLSTDYEVFLLSRVRERYLATGDNQRAVAEGVQSTAPLIFGAAVLMVAVFAAFGFSGLVPIEQLGIGMAFAIVVDATVIRLVLVPVSMKLLGRLNWWFPASPGRKRSAVAASPVGESEHQLLDR